MVSRMLPSTFLAASLISLSACAEQQVATSSLTTVDLKGQQAILSDVQGRCTFIRAGSPPLTLDMPWPCRFSEDQQKKVRIENFRNALIVMVERSEHLPAPSEDCATDLQSIRLYKGKLEVSPVSRVSACGPRYWDQKVLTWQFDW